MPLKNYDKFGDNKEKIMLEKARARGDVTEEEYAEQAVKFQKKDKKGGFLG
jgi:hypothetical protein